MCSESYPLPEEDPLVEEDSLSSSLSSADSPLKPPKDDTLPFSPSALLPTALILSSSVFFAAMSVAVRSAVLNHRLSVPLITFSRALLQFCISSLLLITLYTRSLLSTLTRTSLLKLALRALLGSLSILCKYATLSRLPTALAVALFSTSPLFAHFLSAEPLSPRQPFAFFLTFLGALLVGLPAFLPSSSQPYTALPIILGLAAAFFTGASIVTVRKLDGNVHFIAIVFAISLGTMIAPIVLYAVQHSEFLPVQLANIPYDHIAPLLAVGLFAFAGASCFNRGIQLTTAARASLLRASDIPMNFLIAALVLGEIPTDWMEVGGCVFISIAMFVVASEKGR